MMLFLVALGPDDNVKCYWCGGCLKAWQPTDQPIVEHLRYFPECRLSRQQQSLASSSFSVSICRVFSEFCRTVVF